MPDKNKNTGKSLSDFLRYKSGEMTAEERNSFERELQKDPFAEEASEGFESLSHEEILSDLKKIETLIPGVKVRIKGFVFYRIAASVAVLMVISTIFILVERYRPEKQYTISEKAYEPFEISKGEPVKQKIAENITPGPTRETAKKKEQRTVSGRATAEIRRENIVAEDIGLAKKDVLDSVTDIKDKSAGIYLAEEKMSAPAATAKTKSAAYSNRREIPDTSVFAMDEIVVVGYGVSSKQESETGYTTPQPVTGRAAFDKYIEENIHRPDSIIEGQRAVVVINFTVLTDGKLDRIKIIRSPGKVFSDEAIRLIKSGPLWKPAEENGKVIEEEVRLRIVFR